MCLLTALWLLMVIEVIEVMMVIRMGMLAGDLWWARG